MDGTTVDAAVRDRLAWLLRTVADGPLPDDTAAVADIIGGDDPVGLLTWLRSQIAGFEIDGIVADEPHRAVARLHCPNGRRWTLAVTVDGDAPHRISWVQLDRALPEGMEVREATMADDAGIAHVCRETEIVLRDEAVTIDPGERYFDAVRLMEHPTVLVATHDDRIVAVHCGVFYPVTYGGERQFMAQILHSRVLKEYAGLGLWSVMNRRLVNSARSHREESARSGSAIFENGCAYFATDNDATRRLGGAQATWSFGPHRTVLSCADLAAGETGAFEWRRGGASDAARLAELFNAFHEGEELFVPYTEESLAARLGRAPDLYSWGDVIVGERAALGVWHAGRIHTRRRLDGGAPVRRSVRALVLDHGCERGAEDELEALLRVAAVEAARAGMTDLSVFTSEGCRGAALLTRLAHEVERYELSTPYTPEPEGAVTRGLYVDQIYF